MKKITKTLVCFLLSLTLLLAAFPFSASAEALTWENIFTDVPSNSWFGNAVGYMNLNGYIAGTAANKFSPDETTTRAMFVTILGNMNGIDNTTYAAQYSFSDSAPNWAKGYIAWASENGIASGVGDNKFDPNGKVTREQAATFLYRFAQKNGDTVKDSTTVNKFPDSAKVSAFAIESLSWAVENGIINGSDGKLLPGGNATRAQIAQIFVNYEKHTGKDVEVNIPLRTNTATDLKTKSYVAYYDFMTAEIEYLNKPVKENPYFAKVPYDDDGENIRVQSFKAALFDVTGDGVDELILKRESYHFGSMTNVMIYSYVNGNLKIIGYNGYDVCRYFDYIGDMSIGNSELYCCKGKDGKTYVTSEKPEIIEGVYSSEGLCTDIGGSYNRIYTCSGNHMKEVTALTSTFIPNWRDPWMGTSTWGKYEYAEYTNPDYGPTKTIKYSASGMKNRFKDFTEKGVTKVTYGDYTAVYEKLKSIAFM